MAFDTQRAIIQFSVDDVIGILEGRPVKQDFIGAITAVQVMNRASIAHLSIERALKFLISRADGQLLPNHDLRVQHRELFRRDPEAARSLEHAFLVAVGHYRYNPNVATMKHLGSIETYFEVAGSNATFRKLRYWELTQSMDDEVIRRIFLNLHLEILHAIRELLLERNPIDTVSKRVERAVGDALWPVVDLAFGPGTAHEVSVRAYLEWLGSFGSRSDALAEAVRKAFDLGDAFISHVTSNAYQALLEDPDPAVAYFARSLDVLPRQPRDAVPPVDWLGEEKYQRGIVSTPSGEHLGIIERGADKLWYITPSRPGLVRVAAKATSQKDARSYLATLLTQEAKVWVEENEHDLRLVGSEHRVFVHNYDQRDGFKASRTDDAIWTHKITFWHDGHGIQGGDRVRVKLLPRTDDGLVHMLEGKVTDVERHQVSVSGSDWFDVERTDSA